MGEWRSLGPTREACRVDDRVMVRQRRGNHIQEMFFSKPQLELLRKLLEEGADD